MSYPCQGTTPEVEKQKDNMNELVRKWVSKKGPYKNIARRFDGNYDFAASAIKKLVFNELEIPYDQNFPLSDLQWTEIRKMSETYNNRLGGNWSNFWNGFGATFHISKQDPIASKFNDTLDKIQNFERNNIAMNEHANSRVTEHLREAFYDAGLARGVFGIKEVNDIRKLQKKIMDSDSRVAKLRYMQKLQNIIDSDAGAILNDFKVLHGNEQ